MTLKSDHFRNNLGLLFLMAGFVGACSRDDFPEKIIEPTIAATAPSTMTYMPAEAVGQGKVAGADDLTTIATDDPVVKKILVALQANDDKTLREIEGSVEGMEYVFCPPLVCAGASVEPAVQVQKLIDMIDSLARQNPMVFVKLADYSRRKDGGDSMVSGYWYENAIKLGSEVGEVRFAELAAAEKSGDSYLRLAEIFGGNFADSPSLSAKKSAEYIGKAQVKGISNDGRLRARVLAEKLIKRNGPDVTAPLWPLLFEQYPNPHPVSVEAKAVALKTCVELGGHPENPLSGRDANFYLSTGEKESAACRIVLETDEKNSLALENLGFALIKSNNRDGARIAYARAAELGNSRAIAEYWFNRYPEDPKKMRAALDAEAAAGNPWANLALFKIATGSWNARDKDSKLQEVHLVAATKKNIPAAQNFLAMINDERKSYDEAMKLYKQAAHNGFSSAMFNIGVMYDEGRGVSKSTDDAKKWYERAVANGHAEAKDQLAKLGAAEKAKPEETKLAKADSKSSSGSSLRDKLVDVEWLCTNDHGYISKTIYYSNGSMEIYETPYAPGVAGTRVEYTSSWRLEGDVLTNSKYPEQAKKISIPSDDTLYYQFRDSAGTQTCKKNF